MEYEEIRDRLSLKEELTQARISRRTVLKVLAAGAGISVLPSWMVEQARAAAPLAATDGVLVILQLGGGNDGLNTVVPTADPAYYSLRKNLAVKEGTALPLTQGVGLHPSLVKMQKRFQAGHVAIVQGVGYPKPDMSHFQSMATWMAGSSSGSASTGWLGRYLDGVGSGELSGVAIGNSTPLHLVGKKSSAASLPNDAGGIFGVLKPEDMKEDQTSARLFSGVQAMGAKASTLGSRTGEVAKSTNAAMDLGNTLAPCYPKDVEDRGSMAGQMQLAANLVNANLGIRVIGLSMGSFDTHTGQDWQHKALLTDLDNGVENFFAALDPQLANKVTLMTFSEFGRRVQTDGGGTDHGTAGPMFVIGNQVKGGIIGAQPSLTDLDQSGNMKASIDFHAVYGSVLDGWLNADSAEILGKGYPALPLFASTAGAATEAATNATKGAMVTGKTAATKPMSMPRAS